MRVSLLSLKRKVLYEFPQKFFKTTERNNLAIYDSLCREKQFLLIFIPLTDLIKNSCLNKSKFFSGFFHFKHGKKNKLSEYFIAVSEIATFLTKKRSSLWIPQKFFKTTERYSLAVCGSLCGEKQFFLNLTHFTGFFEYNCSNKSKFSSGFAPFKYAKKNKLSEYFTARFLDSHFYI